MEKGLARHRAVFRQSAEGWQKLASAWRGGAEDEAALAAFVTRALQAARAITGGPALLAALREKDPGEASQFEKVAKLNRDRLIANIRRQMPQLRPHSVSEPNPETPAPGMRR